MVFVGRTPRSARVPLDPPQGGVRKTAFCRIGQADEGVGRRLGGLPHI